MNDAVDPSIWLAEPKGKNGRSAGSGAAREGTRARKWLFVGAGLVLGLPLAGLALSLLFTKSDAPKHKQVVAIALMRPPPPPPPPPKPKEEPPKPKEEVKVEQPAPKPDEPKPMPQQPPPGPIGVDAQGNGPGDGFGLAGRPGGRDITAGTGGGGLGWNLFGAGAARHIAQDLGRDARLKKAGYRIEVRVWLSRDGRFEREELVSGTGDKELDALILEGLHQLSSLNQPIPENLPQPLRIRVTSADG